MTKQHFSILLIGTQMAIGGAQRGLLDQARWFHAHGCQVTVAFFYDKENLHEAWSRAVDFPILDLQVYERGDHLPRQVGRLLRGLWRLWQLLLRGRFDVVETFTHDSNLLGLPLAWLARVPVRIATHRGMIEDFPKWRQTLHNLLINSGIASLLIAVSEQTRQLAIDEGVRPERITVIPNGVTPLDTSSVDRAVCRQELGLADQDIFLVSIGRLTYQKGHEFLVQSLPQILEHVPHIKAGICGEGPLHSQLQSQIAALGLSDHVKLLGARVDVSPILASADLFVLPSRWEGLSRALMEAMAAGVPVVATRVDGIQDLITDGVHGRLVSPEDPQGLAVSILQLLEDPQRMKTMGDAAQHHVLQAHSTDRMCQKHYELILDGLNAPG